MIYVCFLVTCIHTGMYAFSYLYTNNDQVTDSFNPYHFRRD